KRKFRAQIQWVQIVSDGARFYAEELFEVRQRFLEESQRLVIFKIADMLAQDRVPALGEAQSVFQFRATGQDLVQFEVELNWVGCESPGAAQGAFASFEYPDHGIIDSHVDIAVVEQKPVGDIVQAVPSFAIRRDDRFLTQVAARHHQGSKLRGLLG